MPMKGLLCDCSRGWWSTSELMIAVAQNVAFSPAYTQVASCLKCGNRYLMIQTLEPKSETLRYRIPSLEAEEAIEKLRVDQWDARFDKKPESEVADAKN